MLKMDFLLLFFLLFRVPVATSALYVRRFSDENPHDFAISVTKKIRNQFIEMLKQADWMDNDSRDDSIRKVKAMKLIFGYSDELANDTLLNEYYKDLDIQKKDLFLHSVLRAQRFIKNYQIAKLRMPAKVGDWTETLMATNVGAHYFSRENRFRMCLHFYFCFCSSFQLFKNSFLLI